MKELLRAIAQAFLAAADADSEDTAPVKKRGRPAKEEAEPDVIEENFLDDEPAEVEEEEVKLTKDDVRKAIIAYQKKTNAAKAQALLKSFGASTLGELAESKYAAVIKKAGG